MIATIAMLMRHPLAQPLLFVYVKHGPCRLGRRVERGHTLSDARDLVLNACVAAWPRNNARERCNCWQHPFMRDRKQRRLSHGNQP